MTRNWLDVEIKNVYFVCLFLFFILISKPVQGLHIIGGDVRYECVGIDSITNQVTFRFIFNMYRDSRSGGAQFDQFPSFGIYRKMANGSWAFVDFVRANVTDVRDVPLNNDDPCILVPPNLGVQRGTYTFTAQLNIIDSDYMVAYQRCCRNPTIANLLNPDQAGAAFTIEITPEAQRSCNNSPVFNNFPPVILCANLPLSFDHSANDIDGDQIVYEFCAPLTSGGQSGGNGCNSVIPAPINCLPPFREVNFLLPGFSFAVPMSGNPIVSINATTGLISGTPTLIGQFVVGVCIKEFRDGKLLSSTRRDFQFNVQVCEELVKPLIESSFADGTSFTINSCDSRKILFNNRSTDVNYISTYDWEFNLGDKKVFFNTRDVEFTFPERGTYTGKMILNKEEGCKDSADITVNIFPEIRADFEFEYDTCTATPVNFFDKTEADAGSISSWSWIFDNGVSIDKNPSHLFSEVGEKVVILISKDINGCLDTINKQINWLPVPALILVEPDILEACQPATIKFENLSKPIDENYFLNWEFSNGQTSNDISPQIVFTESGVYSAKLEIVSPIGCKTNKYFDNIIVVFPKPIAGFDYTPKELDNFNNEIETQNFSIGGSSWFWEVNNKDRAFIFEPSFVLSDTGLVNIVQIVVSDKGCLDTAFATADVIPRVKVFMPNAFTPNNDGLNDFFKPEGYFIGMKKFEINVWNRWGEMIWQSEDPEQGWDGYLDSDSFQVPNGQYFFKLNYTEPRGKSISDSGNFYLLR